jgi:hypothetical protein
MTRFARVSRRSFLRMLLLLGALVPIRQGKMFLTTGHGCRTGDLLSSKLADFFYDKESAGIVGLEYLRVVPRETDRWELTKLICSGWNNDQLAKAGPEKIKALLLQQQREDFEKGRIVKVQGWILSETEARLCALTVLV